MNFDEKENEIGELEKTISFQEEMKRRLAEKEKLEKEVAEKKRLVEEKAQQETESLEKAREDAEQNFRGTLKVDFLQANPFATEEDFTRLYPILRDAKMTENLRNSKK